MVYNMKFQSQNIGQFTINNLIELTKLNKQKILSTSTSTQITNNKIDKSNTNNSNKTQLFPFRIHRSSDPSQQPTFNNKDRQYSLGKNQPNTCIGITSPLYIDRRQLNQKYALRRSQHGRCRQQSQSKDKDIGYTNTKQYLKKGTLSKHLFEKYLNSKQYRNFNKAQSIEAQSRIHEVRENCVKGIFKKQKKQPKCQIFCGLFNIKCCRCNNKGKLDCFNQIFQQLLKKRGIWYKLKIQNYQVEAQDKIKGYITNKLIQSYLVVKRESQAEKNRKVEPWDNQTCGAKPRGTSKLKQSLQKTEGEVLTFIENYVKNLKISRKDKLNLLDWSYKISEIFKKQLIKNFMTKFDNTKNKQRSGTIEQDQNNQQAIRQRLKKIQEHLFAFERYKQDQSKKGYDDSYKTNKKQNEETKIIFKKSLKDNIHSKLKKKMMKNKNQDQSNPYHNSNDKQNILQQQILQRLSVNSQKNNQNALNQQNSKKSSIKKSRISSSRFSSSLTSDQNKRDSKIKRDTGKSINQKSGTSSGYRQQSKRSKASGFRISSTDNLNTGNLMQKIITQSYIQSCDKIGIIDDKIYEENTVQKQIDEKQIQQDHNKNQLNDQEIQEDEQNYEKLQCYFRKFYQKIKRSKRRNGIIISKSSNTSQNDQDNVENRQFQHFKNQIRKNRKIKKNLEQILQKSGCQDVIIDEEDGMFSALRKISFIQQLSESINIGEAMREFLQKYIEIHRKNRNLRQNQLLKGDLAEKLRQKYNNQVKDNEKENFRRDSLEQYRKMGIKDFMRQDLEPYLQGHNMRLFDLRRTHKSDGQDQNCQQKSKQWDQRPMKRSFGREFILDQVYVYRDKRPESLQIAEIKKNNELRKISNKTYNQFLQTQQFLIQSKI